MTKHNAGLWMLVGVWSLIFCVYLAGKLAWGGMPEQTTMPVYGGHQLEAPWYVTLLIICAPGFLAVCMTIVSTTMLRRVNRAANGLPFNVWTSIKITLGAGALWGLLVQWSMGELVFGLTGIPTSWKLIVIAPFITGLVSMAAYDGLRWYTKDKHPGLYELLSVKHRKSEGHAGGNGDDGDLTRAGKLKK